MFLKDYNKRKQEILGYSPKDERYENLVAQMITEPEVISTCDLPIVNNLRPVVRSSGETIELPPYVIFVRGTPEAFARLETKNKDTLYFISSIGEDKGKLYMGDILISESVTVDPFISPTGTNPVEGRAIYDALETKINKRDLVPITNEEIDEICV